MKLSQADCDRYYRLMWSLHLFVGKKQQCLPEGVETLEDYECLDAMNKLLIRPAVFDNPTVIDEFVEENAQTFPQADLDLMSSWKQAVTGTFHIERLLKKHAIFIAEEQSAVYGVWGLHDDFSELIPKQALPTMVEAVLLPFEGKIIYDGLLQGYGVFFGSGIQADLKEIYMRAKQTKSIITDLLAVPTPSEVTVLPHSQSWESEIADLKQIAKHLRGGGGQSPLCSPAFSLIRASLELAELATTNSQDTAQILKAIEKCDRLISKAEIAVYRGIYY
ncbi:MAG: hypothetical protein AAF974_08130 [Cyanobacteria bacterium P01_E01_bin.34]